MPEIANNDEKKNQDGDENDAEGVLALRSHEGNSKLPLCRSKIGSDKGRAIASFLVRFAANEAATRKPSAERTAIHAVNAYGKSRAPSKQN